MRATPFWEILFIFNISILKVGMKAQYVVASAKHVTACTESEYDNLIAAMTSEESLSRPRFVAPAVTTAAGDIIVV